MDVDGDSARQGEGNVAVVTPIAPVAPVASDVSAEPASLSRPHHHYHHHQQQQHQSSSQSLFPSLSPSLTRPSTLEHHPPPPLLPKASSTTTNQGNNPRRRSLPFAFPPLFFQSNISSASLAPSTAEGKPIPLDDTTAAHRISALKKLNSSYPSAPSRGHTYAKSTGAQSSTYSQPVLVRTYSGPSPSQASCSVHSPRQQSRSSRYRPPSSGRGVSRRVPLPLSSKSGSDLSSRPTKPALSGGAGVGIGNGTSSNKPNPSINGTSTNGVNMPHHKPKKSSSGGGGKLPLPWQWHTSLSRREHDEAKLPPLEAFSFKSFMADMQAQGGENDIGADLDRIAELCARSRYSLSSQYEMHVAPHGSGVSFISGAGGSSGSRRKGHGHSHSHSGGGPTLQAIGSDDDESAARSHRKRRSTGGRRRSVAYGTLETIMSSSRSSEEDKTKKKSATEIVSEVRGRAARKAWDTSTGSGSTSTTTHGGEAGRAGGQEGGTTDDGARRSSGAANRLARKKSASFATAVIDSSRNQQQHGGQNSSVPPVARSTPSALVSEPALPQTSTSHLGVRTAAAAVDNGGGYSDSNSQGGGRTHLPPSPTGQIEFHLADELPHQAGGGGPRASAGSLHSGGGGWSTWIPIWRGGSTTGMGAGPGEDGGGGGYTGFNGGHGGGTTRSENNAPSHAEGSLRQLLRSVDGLALGGDRDRERDKGKSVDREGR